MWHCRDMVFSLLVTIFSNFSPVLAKNGGFWVSHGCLELSMIQSPMEMYRIKGYHHLLHRETHLEEVFYVILFQLYVRVMFTFLLQFSFYTIRYSVLYIIFEKCSEGIITSLKMYWIDRLMSTNMQQLRGPENIDPKIFWLDFC